MLAGLLIMTSLIMTLHDVIIYNFVPPLRIFFVTKAFFSFLSSNLIHVSVLIYSNSGGRKFSGNYRCFGAFFNLLLFVLNVALNLLSKFGQPLQ